MPHQQQEIKTFTQARQRLEEMAGGKYWSCRVDWCGGDQIKIEPYLACELYIEGCNGSVRAKTWAEAFATLEARIRELDSDHDPEALTAGVDVVFEDATEGAKKHNVSEQTINRWVKGYTDTRKAGKNTRGPKDGCSRIQRYCAGV